MRARRFAGLVSGILVPLIRKTVHALGLIAVVSALSGCATAPPLSVEEHLWFDKATGGDITNAPPGLRYQQPAYVYPGDRGYAEQP
jgi:hypothetical protein